MNSLPELLPVAATNLSQWRAQLGFLMMAAATLYAAIMLVARWLRPRSQRLVNDGPPVTVLKPLHGVEPGLERCLRSFFRQSYPHYQLVFGVADAADPALQVVKKLQREFPRLDVAIVIDPAQHGINRKVSNLINMMHAVRHEYLVLADADIAVGPQYLAALVPDLLDDSVGVVTCLYRAAPQGGLWARIGALFIDDWFAPAVYVSHLLGSRQFSFGATQALRRSTLRAIGGLHAVADRLADDFWLGELARKKGLRSVLSPYVVETLVNEPTLRGLVAHELRWMRTIRSARPLGYALMFPSFHAALALLGALLLGRAALPWLILLILLRALLYYAQHRHGPRAAFGDFLLLPLRDITIVWVWLLGFGNGAIRWREQIFSLQPDGISLLPADPGNLGLGD